jgi:hypothetical protein
MIGPVPVTAAERRLGLLVAGASSVLLFQSLFSYNALALQQNDRQAVAAFNSAHTAHLVAPPTVFALLRLRWTLPASQVPHQRCNPNPKFPNPH